ncbi:PREDICTED: uncharacterized protein LOC109158380 [Ipomoea nil]|uniref:uncharacterized protein LOC109158380 n=1 Tax=Ipomoea nil TaxID=35883 RepID=UPI00090180AB|nr:PREDICTED: uncharacterized protein LOC109158380 [Ipomoea nil]
MDCPREESEQSTKEYGEDIEKNDSESESEYVGDEYVDVIDDFEFDNNVDLNVEYVGLGDEKKEAIIEAEAIGKTGFNGPNLNDCPNLSDDASINEFDSDASVSKWSNFRANTDMKNPKFTLGMTFGSKKEFKEAVLNYAFKNGKELKFVRNDKIRYIVECKHNACPWRINLRKDPKCESWRILGMRDIHDGCSWVYKNKMVKSSIVARRWTKEVQHHLDWKMVNFKDKVCTAERFDMSDRQVWRAMEKAKKKIQGDEEENFKKLWGYVAEIDRTNSMSKCYVKLSDLTDMSGHSRFLRLYMCWEACKKGFQLCRPIIGVDGCHLKSATRGQMLIAIGIDGNDSIFPLAYAIVEGETKQSWCWFLEFLKTDLSIGDHNEEEFTFISDKQKGLLEAFEDKLPRSEHRFCVRHLHGNMKVAGFQG